LHRLSEIIFFHFFVLEKKSANFLFRFVM